MHFAMHRWGHHWALVIRLDWVVAARVSGKARALGASFDQSEDERMHARATECSHLWLEEGGDEEG